MNDLEDYRYLQACQVNGLEIDVHKNVSHTTDAQIKVLATHEIMDGIYIDGNEGAEPATHVL